MLPNKKIIMLTIHRIIAANECTKFKFFILTENYQYFKSRCMKC